MSRVTSHLGFGLTYASTFMHPFYTARLLNSLDHITNGRIAFNVITSQRRADYANYGYDELVDHNERYERLEEFIDVCHRLWDSVAPDAFVWDRKTGVVADPTQGEGHQPRRQVLQGQGPAERRTLAAGASGHPPGRRFAARHPRGGTCRRSCLRPDQEHPADGAATQRSRQGAGRGRLAIRRRSGFSGRAGRSSARPRPRLTPCARP